MNSPHLAKRGCNLCVCLFEWQPTSHGFNRLASHTPTFSFLDKNSDKTPLVHLIDSLNWVVDINFWNGLTLWKFYIRHRDRTRFLYLVMLYYCLSEVYTLTWPPIHIKWTNSKSSITSSLSHVTDAFWFQEPSANGYLWWNLWKKNHAWTMLWDFSLAGLWKTSTFSFWNPREWEKKTSSKMTFSKWEKASHNVIPFVWSGKNIEFSSSSWIKGEEARKAGYIY